MFEMNSIQTSELLLKNFENWLYLQNFSRYKLELLRKTISKVITEKYKSHHAIYRGVNRCFRSDELKLFLNICTDIKYRTMFTLLSCTGLRVSEVCDLKIEDLDLEERSLKVRTRKQKEKVIDFQPIPESIIPMFNLYFLTYKKRLSMKGGWLFPNHHRRYGPTTTKAVRDAFSRIRKACNLDRSYALANDKNNPNMAKIGQRKLYQLTVHSFRHTFKLSLDKGKVQYGLIQSLMRHSGRSITDKYGSYSFGEKKEVVDEVFE
jgi:integrase